MAFTTRARLRKASRRTLVEKHASALSLTSNVFLSHSSNETEDDLGGAVSILGAAGGRVYVDKLDPAAKRLTPRRFGAFFREAIVDCGRLVVLLSKATATSLWVPWELGLADGMFGKRKTAVWPIGEKASDGDYWATQEYLAIYPTIEEVELDGVMQWGVKDPEDGKYWRLGQWLSLR